ncbi:MAG TPA: hypothetical protein VIU82_12765 [Bosea sp. (in: a-proteobacteria)]
MMRTVAAIALATGLVFAGVANAVVAQGVYDELVKAQKQMESAPSIKPLSQRELCEQFKASDGGQKCREFYVGQGFKQDWVGNTPFSHPGVVEVLALGQKGVLCAHHNDIQDLTPCFEMKRPDAFSGNR